MSAAVGGDLPGGGIKPTLRPSKAAQAAQAKAKARPAAESPPPGEEDEKPRRRRRPDKETMGNAAKRLAGWHSILAAMMKAPELMITEAEAEQLVIVGSDLAAEFDLEVGGKAAAAVAFIGTAAAVYFPRMIALSMRVQAAREAAGRPPGPVVEGEPVSE